MLFGGKWEKWEEENRENVKKKEKERNLVKINATGAKKQIGCVRSTVNSSSSQKR
jgi:hypothetical protein